MTAQEREAMIVNLFVIGELHEAIDRLFAMLIARDVEAKRQPVFVPTKAGQPWTATQIAYHLLSSGRRALRMTPAEIAAEASVILHRRAKEASR